MPDTRGRAQTLREALDRFLARVPDTDVQKVILFGSLSRGAVRTTSDVDLVVIRPTKAPFLRRSDDLLDLFPEGVAVDLLVYTPEEWEALSTTRDFQKTARREGVVVYDAAEGK